MSRGRRDWRLGCELHAVYKGLSDALLGDIEDLIKHDISRLIDES